MIIGPTRRLKVKSHKHFFYHLGKLVGHWEIFSLDFCFERFFPTLSYYIIIIRYKHKAHISIFYLWLYILIDLCQSFLKAINQSVSTFFKHIYATAYFVSSFPLRLPDMCRYCKIIELCQVIDSSEFIQDFNVIIHNSYFIILLSWSL